MGSIVIPQKSMIEVPSLHGLHLNCCQMELISSYSANAMAKASSIHFSCLTKGNCKTQFCLKWREVDNKVRNRSLLRFRGQRRGLSLDKVNEGAQGEWSSDGYIRM